MKTFLNCIALLNVGWTIFTLLGFRAVLGWSLLPRQFHGVPTIQTPSTALFHNTAEVVGASGRIGSFWLCHGGEDNHDELVAVPRGVAPGGQTLSGSPILVATPRSTWEEIYQSTPPGRRCDLVWLGNGLVPGSALQETTIVVPHYAVLKRVDCGPNSAGRYAEPPRNKTVNQVPTLVFGKHADYVISVLSRQGIPTQRLTSLPLIQLAAAQKVLWASCLWLLCHQSDPPRTVHQVLQDQQDDLGRLVEELLPSLQNLVTEQTNQTLPIHIEQVIGYMVNYTKSLPINTIPSKHLALEEIQDRNAVWLDHEDSKKPQVFHRRLLERVGLNVTDIYLAKQREKPSRRAIFALSNSNLYVHASTKSTQRDSMQQKSFVPPPRRVVVIGSGILGSAVALELARTKVFREIVVLDQGGSNQTTCLGSTTPASWAWLNANGKLPLSYRRLNQLGLQVWREEPVVRDLVSWNGSLVRYPRTPAFLADGGYPWEGPVCHERVRELEPLIGNWSDADASETYYFPEEGKVDPLEAVEAFQEAAKKLGVQFWTSTRVAGVESRETDNCRVSYKQHPGGNDGYLAANVVIVAAGIATADPSLGAPGVQLRPNESMGTLAFANATNLGLSRILVDTVRNLHILQRSNGDLVAGGGSKLEFGGSASFISSDSTAARPRDQEILSPQDAGQLIASSPYIPWTRTAQAIRPMPLDGLPIVGWSGDQRGVYAMVTHSGMTLGPLLAKLVALEVTQNCSMNLLEVYRPHRFDVVRIRH